MVICYLSLKGALINVTKFFSTKRTGLLSCCSSVVQVLSKGHLLGPAGVEVKLSRVGTDEKLQSVITQPGGK